MLNQLTADRATAAPMWMVRVRAVVGGAGGRAARYDTLEPMIELMQRTAGVRSATVIAVQAGATVGVCLSAPDAATAAARARALVTSGARYAGLGEVTIDRVQVAPATTSDRWEA